MPSLQQNRPSDAPLHSQFLSVRSSQVPSNEALTTTGLNPAGRWSRVEGRGGWWRQAGTACAQPAGQDSSVALEPDLEPEARCWWSQVR